jgi:hypothetical protein
MTYREKREVHLPALEKQNDRGRVPTIYLLK